MSHPIVPLMNGLGLKQCIPNVHLASTVPRMCRKALKSRGENFGQCDVKEDINSATTSAETKAIVEESAKSHTSVFGSSCSRPTKTGIHHQIPCTFSSTDTKTVQHGHRPCDLLNKCQLWNISDNVYQSCICISPQYVYASSSKQLCSTQPSSISQWRAYSTSSPDRLHNGDEVSFVSSTDIKRYLRSSKLGYETGHTCLSTTCPVCNFSKKDVNLTDSAKRTPDQNPTMFVNMTTGHFQCFHCESSGSWTTFQDIVSLLKIFDEKQTERPFELPSSVMNMSDPSLQEKIHEYWSSCLPVDHENAKDTLFYILKKLKLEKLTVDTLSKYHARVSKTERSLVLPYYHYRITDKIVGLKVMKCSDDARSAVEEYSIPRSGCVGVFGHQLCRKRREVVLTASEVDCMAVSQETRLPAVGLPRGTCLLPQEVLPFLEHFSKVTLWFDNDVKSWQSAKVFARKLNERRCFYISPRPEHPSPAAALRSGLNMTNLVKQSEPIKHRSIVSFSALREEVLAELQHHDQIAGTKWKRFPKLNQILRGHRRGELTVLTGATGSGKTTFLADYSLDLCMQGCSEEVNTLWGSFEIPNRRLAKMMLMQYTRTKLENKPEVASYWADKFETLPLYFLTFHGQEKIKTVLETMAHAVYVYDIEHVVIDNLQFMMGTYGGGGMDRFWQQDVVIQQFRKFATFHNCHLTLVIHPRKEEVETLSIASIFGGAKASQEADNVLILQSLEGRKYIQVAKNRFDGTLGSTAIYFDKESRSFTGKLQKKPKEEKSSQQ